MSKILIIGNVLKDVYIKLDDRKTDFETDENGIDWLNLGFNGAAHNFFQRTSVYGGAAVSLSVLQRLGLSSEILGSRTEVKDGDITWLDQPDDYRYIFCHRDEITYFVPTNRQVTDWVAPSDNPDWILIDRSATASSRLVDELKNFLKFSPTTKLAVHAEKYLTPAGQDLRDLADIVFLEDEPPIHQETPIVDKVEPAHPNQQLVCHISPRKIVFSDAEESWSLDKTDMMTHLTVYSTIVATILGVISVGGSPADAVLWARINAEQTTIAGSLSAKKLRELATKEKQKRDNLQYTVRLLMAPGKGLLALDQSDATLTEQLVRNGIKGSAPNRDFFRELVITTPDLEKYLSGVIISESSASQKVQHQTLLDYVISRGLVPGLKADQGLAKIKATGEPYTTGSAHLFSRLRTAFAKGYRFAKWRAEFQIATDQPSFIAVEQNTDLLANFAKECQLACLVPVIEADLIRSGDHTIEQCAATTDHILCRLCEKLEQRHVNLSSCIIKTNMITASDHTEKQPTPAQVGMATAAILRHSIPRFAAGVLLLSGGQAAKTATEHLTAICQNGPFPWPLSFAFGRALSEPVLKTWKGDKANLRSAQAALKRHLEANSDALHYLTK